MPECMFGNVTLHCNIWKTFQRVANCMFKYDRISKCPGGQKLPYLRE